VTTFLKPGETYEYLMQEPDIQKRNFVEIEIEEHFMSID